MLPPLPTLIPEDLRAVAGHSEWAPQVSPQAVGMFVAAVARWMSAPRIGADVTVETTTAGWVIRVDLPQPAAVDDVIAVGSRVDADDHHDRDDD